MVLKEEEKSKHDRTLSINNRLVRIPVLIVPHFLLGHCYF